ncbi:DUF2570 domain-containing protein [Serratia sp. 3ACOL1]|nr:DUF2570 domain-containing protein [Serratia sp. 3ACOL1]
MLMLLPDGSIMQPKLNYYGIQYIVSLMIIKKLALIILTVVIGGNGLLIYTQQKNINKLRQEYQRVSAQADNMKQQLALTRTHSIILSETLEKQINRRYQLWEKTHVTREALRKAQGNNWCAGQSVPDDVIRLQYKTLNSN